MARPFALDPLFQSTKALAGVGPRLTKLLEGLTGPRVADLLWHLPSGIIDRRYAPKIAAARAGIVATLKVRVEEHLIPKRPSLPYRVRCVDDTGMIDLIFFNVKGDYLIQQLPIGEERLVSGKLDTFNGLLQMPHPDVIAAVGDFDLVATVEPVYPLTAGIVHKTILKIIRQAVSKAPVTEEWIDESLLRREKWMPWQESLRAAHHPQSEEDLSPLHPARRRLAYDEMLANQITLGLVRAQQKKKKGRGLSGDDALHQKALSALPFTLTAAQEKAVDDIRADMQTEDRMFRLLQGDVGSGKTAVAFLAAIHAIGSGGQAVIMAPTEILARQHEKNISKYASTLGIGIETLTGRDKGKARDKILERIKSGAAGIIIGTHALFQEDVSFKDLALVVIDEQHRFGVHQRLQLSEKGNMADILVMTATPIPRTLVMTVYGDMDVSRLTEKPAGRKPIDTRLVSNDRIHEVIDALPRKIAAKERIYWVCPLVEESEKLDLAAAEERYRHLQERFGVRVGLLHGRMKPADKDSVMATFASGALDILVATTVIEVGVDVPEATVMVIEHAERFGLAQLHQLRGRIGRGSEKSACILLFNPHIGEMARQRLTTLRDTEDGFLIAEKDLQLRGSGEVLGTKQSGLPAFRVTQPEFHGDLIQIAHDDARLLLDKDPHLLSPRGLRIRTLLYLFERDAAVKYLQAA